MISCKLSRRTIVELKRVPLDVDMERLFNSNLVLSFLIQLKIHEIFVVKLMPLVQMTNEISRQLSRVAPWKREANWANDWNNMSSVVAVAVIQQMLPGHVDFLTERAIKGGLIRWARVAFFLVSLRWMPCFVS